MIAIGDRFDQLNEPSKPMILFLNIKCQGDDLVGDCTACHAKKVNIMEHCCSPEPARKTDRKEAVKWLISMIAIFGLLTALLLWGLSNVT